RFTRVSRGTTNRSAPMREKPTSRLSWMACRRVKAVKTAATPTATVRTSMTVRAGRRPRIWTASRPNIQYLLPVTATTLSAITLFVASWNRGSRSPGQALKGRGRALERRTSAVQQVLDLGGHDHAVVVAAEVRQVTDRLERVLCVHEHAARQPLEAAEDLQH